MAINLITFTGQTVSPMHDAIIHEMMTGAGGILHGCAVTASGNELHIAAGFGVVKGRLFEISDTTISVELATGSTKQGRLYVRLDLGNAVTPISIETAVASTLYALTKEANANYNNGIYEMSLATFQVSTSQIENLAVDYNTLSSVVDLVYPVGSIYTSVNSANPATLFGGTWQQITGRFLLGRSASHAAGETGGAETRTIGVRHLPAHAHAVPSHSHTMNHKHTVPAHTHAATIRSAGAHTHTGSTSSAGAHVHAFFRWLGAAAGTDRWASQGTSTTTNTQSAGAHTHTVTIASGGAHTHEATIASGGSGNTGTYSGNTGEHAGRTEETGLGEALYVMPPFLAVYIWKRTA